MTASHLSAWHALTRTQLRVASHQQKVCRIIDHAFADPPTAAIGERRGRWFLRCHVASNYFGLENGSMGFDRLMKTI
jgi:hypothetical protein